MNISPEQENGIIKLILRDTHEILTDNTHFSFGFASEVKLQKLVFIIADKLDIPLTRSWYRHGGFVHNDIIKFRNLQHFPQIISKTGDRELKKAEQVLSEIRSDYVSLLQELVPRIFFMRLEEVLEEVYADAPEEYKPMYYTNLAIEKEFDIVKNFDSGEIQIWQDSIDRYISNKDYKTMFSVYTRFSRKISSLILEISNLSDFSCLYGCTNNFAEMLDDYLIKLGFTGNNSLDHLKALKNIYENTVWNSIALKISVNTVKGVNAELVKAQQEVRFYDFGTNVEQKQDRLKNKLMRDNMMPSLEERKQFFNIMYRDDKEFFGAVSNVWKSYK